MYSDSTRHSEAKDRHEERLNATRAEGISDEFWAQFTQPVDSLDMVVRKLRSIKQQAIPVHIIEAHQAEDRPKLRQDERKKHLKSQEKRDFKLKGTESDEEKCFLCDKKHAKQSCKFLNKCRMLASEKHKAPKSDVFAVMEEASNETGGDNED